MVVTTAPEGETREARRAETRRASFALAVAVMLMLSFTLMVRHVALEVKVDIVQSALPVSELDRLRSFSVTGHLRNWGRRRGV